MSHVDNFLVPVWIKVREQSREFQSRQTSGKSQGTLRWRHNRRDSVSNHQPHDCLLNRLFRRRSKKTSKLRVTGLCAGNLPGTGEFPAQVASNAENVSIWWRHHDFEHHNNHNNHSNHITTALYLLCIGRVWLILWIEYVENIFIVERIELE